MPTFSHSRIEAFRRCPRQYFYRYVARVKLPEVPEHVATFFGSRCHDALEWLYARVMIGAVPTRKQVLAEFGRVWEEKWAGEIVIREQGMTPKLYRALGEKCVGDYFDIHHPFDDAKTIGLEKRVSFPLDADADIRMVGYIDRLAKDADCTWHVHDYKTNRSLPTQAEKDADPQLAYYEIGLRQMWPNRVKRVELHWHFLRFGETITSTRMSEELEDLRQAAIATIHDALARGKHADAFEPKETPLCDYCDFQSICPVKKHEVTVSGLPAKRYRNEPGVKLVNRWSSLKQAKAELVEQVGQIDEEIGEVQEALIEYADAQCVSVVVGDEHEATIKRDEKTMFPRKGSEPEQHAELERRLIESSFWDQVSSVDATRLKSLWKQPEALDPRLRKLLERFVWMEEETRIGLRTRRG